MPVGFNSPARNLFLLGSSGAQVVTNFFKSIDQSSTTDGVFLPDEIRYNYTDQKYVLAGSAADSNSKGFGWFEKRDETGALDFANRVESTVAGVNTTLRAMELDSNNNLIVAGFSGTTPWIAKYSNAGVLDWQSTTNSANVRYTGLASDSNGNYYASGRTSYALPDTQAFVEKFDSNGNPGWGKSAFILGRDVVLRKISANSRGEVVAVGFLEDDSADKGYIVKIDTNTGEVLWDRTLERNISGHGFGTGSTDSITPADVRCQACYIDSNDQIYVVGSIDGNSPNNNGVGEFLIKYTAEGNMVWQRENNTRDFNASDGAPNMIPFDVKSDGETEQTVVLSVEDNGPFALNNSNIFISKYSKNGDLVYRRQISKGGENLGNASLDADPSFYYILFEDQEVDGLAGTPDRYTFGKVSTSGNGLGAFQYDDGAAPLIDYTIVSSGRDAESKIGRLSDGSVRNDTSDLITYPFTANKLVFDDLATHVSNKKRQMDNADSFEYSGSPAIRPADFQELNLLGSVYSGSGDWLDQSGKGNDAEVSDQEPFSGTGAIRLIDAAADFFEVPYSNQFILGTEWTIEFYIKAKTQRGSKLIGTRGDSAPNGWEIVYNFGQIGVEQYGDQSTSGQQRTSQLLPVNTWTHVAVVNYNGGVKIYYDGVDTGFNWTGSSGSTWPAGGSHPLRIGKPESYNESPDVLMSNIRIVTGSAIYTSSFNPPSLPLTNTGQSGGGSIYSDYFYGGPFNHPAVNAFDGSTTTRAEPSDNKTIYVDFSHVNPTGTLLNFNGNSKLPTYLDQGGNTAIDGLRSNPIYHAFDGSTSTYCNMTYLNGQFSRLTFENPITNVTNITIGYDGEGDPGYNGGNHQTSISFNGSRQTVQLYNGSAITLTNLDFISQPGNGVCRLYDVTVTVGGTATTLTLDGGVSVSSSLRTYLAKAGSPSANHFTVNTQSLGGSVPSNGWLTINGVSKLKQIALYHQSGSSSVELFAVEVDGSILTDGGSSTGTVLLTAQGTTMTDASDSNHTITSGGGAAIGSEFFNVTHNSGGGYWTFDGTDDYISGSSPILFGTDTGSIEAWISTLNTSTPGGAVYSESTPGDNTYWGHLRIHGGKPRFVIDDDSVIPEIEANVTVSDGAWHHIVVTGDGSNYAMYVDGVSYTPSYITGSGYKWFNNTPGLTTYTIGALERASTGNYFTGAIGEVRVYPRALTAAQVFQNYNATKSRFGLGAASTNPGLTSTRTP